MVHSCVRVVAVSMLFLVVTVSVVIDVVAVNPASFMSWLLVLRMEEKMRHLQHGASRE